MPYTISYLEEDDVLLTVYQPPSTPEMLHSALIENLTLAREHGALRFLGDCRQLPVSGDPREVYELAEMLERAGFDTRSREALIVHTDPTIPDKNYELFARVASRNGVQVRVFGSVEDGLAWLRTCKRTPD